MYENEDRSAQSVGEDLDVGSGSFAAGGAGARESQSRFNVMFYLAND